MLGFELLFSRSMTKVHILSIYTPSNDTIMFGQKLAAKKNSMQSQDRDCAGSARWSTPGEIKLTFFW